MASVLITGTSTGIGLETALALGRAGHNVYATMRNPSWAPELGEKTSQEGLRIKISVMDVESGTWQLRHPVGPDAEPLLAWRMTMTDEEWVELNAADDDTVVPAHGA